MGEVCANPVSVEALRKVSGERPSFSLRLISPTRSGTAR